MDFVFFRFRRTDKMDSMMKGLMGQCPQNFWARPPWSNAEFSKLVVYFVLGYVNIRVSLS